MATTIKAKDVTPLASSFQPKEGDATKYTYQANANLYVDGNPYASIVGTPSKPNLVTPVTVMNLEIAIADMANLESVTQTQVDAWVTANYPSI